MARQIKRRTLKSKNHAGVFEYNTSAKVEDRPMRNEQMGKNVGKYALLSAIQENPFVREHNDVEVPPTGTIVGGLYDVYAREQKYKENLNRMGAGGLLAHTLSEKSYLGQELNAWYHRNPQEMEVFVTPIVSGDLLKRNLGKFENYLDYMSDIGHLSFTKELMTQLAAWDENRNDAASLMSILPRESVLYDTLSNMATTNNIKVAMEVNKVGVVRHFSVQEATDGIITTNVNNFSHRDTELGKITNELYASTLRYASYFNTARNTHYITDYLRNYYGTNAHNIKNLTYRLYVSQETGRMEEIDNNAYIKDLSIYRDGEFTDIADYADSIEYKTEYDTDYNRFQNIHNNWQELPSAYSAEHSIYNPFEVYSEFGVGKSVDDAFTEENAYTIFANNSRPNDRIYFAYNEGDEAYSTPEILEGNVIDGETFLGISDVAEGDPDKLLGKTEKLFRERKIGTLVGRFHSSSDTDKSDKVVSSTQTAISKFGISHGRNLLTKKGWTTPQGDLVNEYNNPYCRVWTYHHQYSRLKDAIRPFLSEEDAPMGIAELQENWGRGIRTNKAGERLENYGTMNNNGLPNIAPTRGTTGVDIRNCMFSIENLAWKDVNKNYAMNDTDNILSDEQIGPNGGRIMWFPPYNLKFNENVSANWNEENFIGRGEPVVTYTNTTRKGTLDFTILVDHPSIVDSWRKGKANPTEDDEQELLRFFAGCGVLQPSETGNTIATFSDTYGNDGIDSNGVNQYGIENMLEFGPSNGNPNGVDNGGNSSNPSPVHSPNTFAPDPEQTEDIVFYVFYPNNYSGENDDADDAFQYLLFGKNRNLAPSYDNPGYEMEVGRGITEDFVPGEGDTGKWGYRVDQRYIGQILAKGNYSDTASSGINSTYDAVASNAAFGDATCSFAEFYGACKYTDSDLVGKLSERGADVSRMEHLNQVLGKGIITNIVIYGGASTHGYTKINTNRLAPMRAQTVKRWLMENVIADKSFNVEITDTREYDVGTSLNNVSGYEAKAGRYACAKISVKVPEATLAEENTDRRWSKAGSYIAEGLAAAGNEEFAAGAIEVAETPARKNMEGGRKWIQTLKQTANSIISNTSKTGYRYDYESSYFSQLSVNDPVMHKRIVDKFKYFDPAFHSITPEGFNARLTFLQQCTRQGHTISSSDSNGWSTAAGNLSFGRPPICVLRIGDFFNTKIAITSLNITYDTDGIRWDMNPEGVGLQPMYCDVSLGITFLGGSDIAAPVSRLQNAVSFNYYANTSLYDNRSDTTTYNGKTEDAEYTSQWTPYPNATK